MPATTPVLDLPYPTPDDQVDVPRDMQALAEAIDPIGARGVPIGALMMWPTAVAPTNWLLCQGQQVDAATYPELATLLGSAAGKITLPNLTARMPLGAGGGYALGENGGAAQVALTAAEIAAHAHGITDPGHTHADDFAVAAAYAAGGAHLPTGVSGASWTVERVAAGTAGYVPQTTGNQTVADTTANHAHTLNGAVSPAATGLSIQAAGGGAAHNNLPPYLVVNYIIRAS